MHYNDLSATMDHLLQSGKGLLAADESTPTIGKRFAAIGLENTVENRRDYRALLAETPGLSEYVHGVILYEETFHQQTKNGTPIATLFAEQGILPGIKVDQGLAIMPNTEDEKITLGLDTLAARLDTFKALGARFAKWRNVYTISEFTPSHAAIRSGAENLARYAATCQAHGIVPIVEPEILMDGAHNIEHCAETAELVLHELFRALFTHQVELELMILKPSMITCGKSHHPFTSADDIADYTIHVFRNMVPAAVPAILFLSGGQTPQQATENLNAINQLGEQPWCLSFSYGRALQEECLQQWQGKHVHAAQTALLRRAHLLHLACLGEYDPSMEAVLA